MGVGADANGAAAEGRGSLHFRVAEVDVAVAGVDGHVVVDLVGRAKADVPGEVGLAFVLAGDAVAVAVVHVHAQVVEGKAEARAHVGGEGRRVVEIVVDVGKQRGRVEGLLALAARAGPAALAVAAKRAFQLDAQGNHVLRPEVVAGGQGAAESELGVVVDTESAEAGVLHRAEVLHGHQELGSQVHAGAFRGGGAGKGEGADERQSSNDAFHDDYLHWFPARWERSKLCPARQ